MRFGKPQRLESNVDQRLTKNFNSSPGRGHVYLHIMLYNHNISNVNRKIDAMPRADTVGGGCRGEKLLPCSRKQLFRFARWPINIY